MSKQLDHSNRMLRLCLSQSIESINEAIKYAKKISELQPDQESQHVWNGVDLHEAKRIIKKVSKSY